MEQGMPAQIFPLPPWLPSSFLPVELLSPRDASSTLTLFPLSLFRQFHLSRGLQCQSEKREERKGEEECERGLGSASKGIPRLKKKKKGGEGEYEKKREEEKEKSPSPL
jgi:hypothetical protein